MIGLQQLLAAWETWWKMGVTQSCDDMGGITVYQHSNTQTFKYFNCIHGKSCTILGGLKRNPAKKHPFSSNTMHKKSRQKMG